ncbi:MAG: lytic transglycosylase domain-containing protein [Desulfosarcina sp.]|nr:lytic transglycosylase domain-containing protein [Desulfosarcina sp.]
MNPDNQHPHMPSLWKDVVVFFVTVAVCSFFLTAACTLTKQSEIEAYAAPVLAMPQPPVPLELASRAESDTPVVEAVPVMPSFDGAWAAPVFDVCLAFPEIEADPSRVDTRMEMPPAPAGGLPNESIPFHGIIIQVAGRYEVDPHLIRAIILAESGYNPKAKSKKGARGLMQLMPSTAKSLGVEDIYDPEENIDGGVRYFRSLLDRFDGDVQLALAAYNAGSRHVRNYEGIPPFKATQHYIKKVLKFHKKFQMQNMAGSRRLA